MSKIRSRDTKPEVRLRKKLFSTGLRYRIHYKKMPGTPDIAFPGKKVAVFCHGCFWHGHEGCYKAPKSNSEYWKDKLEKNRARDERNKTDIEARGWTYVRVWECEIRKDLERVSSYIHSLCT